MMQMLRGLFGGRRDEVEEKVDVLEDAQARVQRNPDDAGAHYDLGTLHYVRGQIEEAADVLERTIRLAPDNADAHYMLGLAYQQLERYEDARHLFQTVMEETENSMLRGYAEEKLNELERQRAGGNTGAATG